jgi:hypothetical protein
MRAAYSTRKEPLRVFPTFLHKERMACWAAQRPIGLRGKHGTRKPMRKGGSRPVRWPVGRWPIQRVLRGLGFVCRESRREAKPRGQRERFRQREEQHLGEREEKEEDRHREGTWAAPEPANRPSPSRASWSPVRAAPTPSEGSRSDFLMICQNSCHNSRPRHPAIGGLFLIFIGQHRLERTPMEIHIEPIRRRKRVGGQGREKLLIDRPFPHFADRRT